MTTLIELNDDYSETIHYDRPDYPIYVRRGTLSHYPNYAAPSHWHDDVELINIDHLRISFTRSLATL